MRCNAIIQNYYFSAGTGTSPLLVHCRKTAERGTTVCRVHAAPELQELFLRRSALSNELDLVESQIRNWH